MCVPFKNDSKATVSEAVWFLKPTLLISTQRSQICSSLWKDFSEPFTSLEFCKPDVVSCSSFLFVIRIGCGHGIGQTLCRVPI